MRYFGIVQSTQDGHGAKTLSIGWINQDPGNRGIRQSVLDCSRSYQASRSKGNRIALSSTKVVCGLTMLRGTRHKPEDILRPTWASMSSKHFHNII